VVKPLARILQASRTGVNATRASVLLLLGEFDNRASAETR